LARCMTVCPMGVVKRDILGRVADSIETRCGINCRVAQKIENPRYAFNESRGQYNAKLILNRLEKYCPTDTLRLIAVTPVDLYVPILKYVFGLSQVEGRCAVISMHRLRPEFYDQPPDLDVLITRTEKTALHEVAHSLGLTHCREKRCVMSSSTRIEDTDFKNLDFCPTCRELFIWYLERRRGCPMP
jgi:archaemetzincin